MPLNKDQMREYKRKKRAEAAGKIYIPEAVNPKQDNCKPESVNINPVVNQECLKCKPEYERGLQEGYSKGYEAGFKAGSVTIDRPVVRPSYSSNYFNPQPKATKPDKPSKYIPPATKASACNMPDPVISSQVLPGDTIYETDPVKPAKKPKVSVNKQVSPVVSELLSGVKRSPIISHHPQGDSHKTDWALSFSENINKHQAFYSRLSARSEF